MKEVMFPDHENTDRRRRVAVTGIGLICGLGCDREQVWQRMRDGESGIRNISGFDTCGFPTRFAAEVQDFNPESYIDKKDVKKTSRFIQFAIAATQQALQQSGLRITDENAERTGVNVGSGIGGFEAIEREYCNLLRKGPSRVSPFFIAATLINLAAGQISIRTGAKGPNLASATACATSAHSIGDSFRLIQTGKVNAMICGGAEACITPLGLAGFNAMRALSTRNDDPQRASRPWDRNRDGFVMGEGAGILVLEELDSAIQRGVEILAEMIGYGCSSDAGHITAPPENGEGAARSMRDALQDAGICPSSINYINAHATSTKLGDSSESHAVASVFKEHSSRLTLSSIKSMTGHLLGAAGGLAAGVTVLALRDQIVPPTINLEDPDHECSNLDYIPQIARPMKVMCALSNSFGFGGTNASLVFRRYLREPGKTDSSSETTLC
jgi:3-oxoacyl-[acyl-carrier-protein] synthase II